MIQMKNCLELALCLMFLIGCGGCLSKRATYLSDGVQGYTISCRGPFKHWNDCMLTAGHLCRSRGYAIRYQDEVEHEMIIACRVGTRDSAPQASN